MIDRPSGSGSALGTTATGTSRESGFPRDGGIKSARRVGREAIDLMGRHTVVTFRELGGFFESDKARLELTASVEGEGTFLDEGAKEGLDALLVGFGVGGLGTGIAEASEEGSVVLEKEDRDGGVAESGGDGQDIFLANASHGGH